MILDPSGLPGEDLIAKGIADLSRGARTIESLLVQIGAPKLRKLGFSVASESEAPERDLYELLARDGEDSAHGRYNALVRRLVSFEHAAESRVTARSA